MFEECLELDAEARVRLLAAADAAVATEVEALLQERVGAAGRMDPDACHRALLDATTQVVGRGSQIGRYRIVSVLGHGGMGTVYLAEQDEPRRRVALKLLAATVAGQESAQRFRLEAELLGRLRHHGIAQIYEASVHEEVTSVGVMRWPFFAMEYVEGATTLASWAADRELSTRAKIEVFLQVCAAVQHAHERGIVHRDLKPQNVLLDADGAVKVIDFGIARAFGGEEHLGSLTQTGELIGTLHYMAPEQVSGNNAAINTRTDVHALGVVLYELLANRLPLDLRGKTLPEVGRWIGEVEPTPLRRAMPAADADLELILATAMAKDPGRRYASAGSLAEELQRYLDREPIRARPPSLRYQLWMFARRRRGLVAAVLALLVVSTVGGVTSLFYAFRAHEAEQKAITEGDQKVDAMRLVFDKAIERVLDLPRRLQGAPGATTLQLQVIGEAVEQLEFVEQNAPLDDGMRLSLARAYLDLGGVQGANFGGNDGDREAAVRSFERARSYLDHVLADQSDHVEALFLLFDVESELGTLAFNANRRDPGAQERFRAAVSALERLRRCASAADPRLAKAEASVLIQRGHNALSSMDAATAVKLFAAARESQVAALGDAEPDEPMRIGLAELFRDTAVAEMSRGRHEESAAAFEQAIALLAFLEDRPHDWTERRLLATIRQRYGYLLASSGRGEAGERHMRWALEELERLAQLDPDNARSANTLGSACQYLADHLAIQAKYEPDATRRIELFTEARNLASRGLQLGRAGQERARDMVNTLVVAECERILAVCDDALR